MIQEAISYEEIRKRKITEYGTEFKDWIWLFVKQYKDRTHFLFELLQNAEDAKAKNVRIRLFHDKLIIEHDGILFSKEDVISITKVAKSTKNTQDSGSIGKFGIGFKSVYVYAATPRIYSGDYSFEIRDFIYPYEIDAVKLEKGYTRIVIPFNNGEIDAEKAFKEIQRALAEQIKTNTLLFLNNIEELSIKIEDCPDEILITKEDREIDCSGNFLDVNIQYSRYNCRTDWTTDREENYLLISDCEEEAVKLAFGVNGKDLVPYANTNIFTFFPTDKESHQAFYIHAPFDTTPARDNIIEDSERNKKFIENICEMLHGGFCWMRDNGYLSLKGLNDVFPIYEYPEDSIFYRIYESAVNIIASGEKIIPTNKSGEFKSKNEICFPENMSMVNVFSDEDIKILLENRRMFWIAKEIVTDAYMDLRNFLKQNFEFKTYYWNDLVTKLNASFLERKEKSWFESLFPLIGRFCVMTSAKRLNHEIDIREIPFVRLADGKHICAYENDTPIVYINNPKECPNIIDGEFCNSQVIRKFYIENLKIPKYDIERIVLDDILPKYKEKENIKFVTQDEKKENIADLKKIKDAMNINPQIVESVKECYIVTDGKSWYRPTELHISFGGMKQEFQLVKGICNLKFLSSDYEREVKLDEKFFTIIGCADSLMDISVGKEEYLEMVRKYIGRDESYDIRRKIFAKHYQKGFKWDTCFEGFPKVLEEIDLKKSVSVVRFLNKSIMRFKIRGEIFGANDQGYSGTNADSMSIYSAMGILLTFVPWLYTVDGKKVTVASANRRELDPVYEKEGKKFLDMLPFKSENEALDKLLAEIKDPQEREIFKMLATNPAALEEVTKAYRKRQMQQMKREEKRSKSPKEILEEEAKKKGQASAERGIPEPEAVNNPELRKKKLEAEFQKSMDYKINLGNTSLKYTYQDKLSPEEKNFLRITYEGHCQICGTAIAKLNGEKHFQAINVIKTSTLEDKYRESLAIGWNSLCLCPNCAAKYRYGAKDISEFYNQVCRNDVEAGEEEFIEIRIGLQDKEETIKYAPKHFLALKTALEMFG